MFFIRWVEIQSLIYVKPAQDFNAQPLFSAQWVSHQPVGFFWWRNSVAAVLGDENLFFL